MFINQAANMNKYTKKLKLSLTPPYRDNYNQHGYFGISFQTFVCLPIYTPEQKWNDTLLFSI